jgi:hypothetical protein
VGAGGRALAALPPCAGARAGARWVPCHPARGCGLARAGCLATLPRFQPFAPCRCGRALGGMRAWQRHLPRSKVVGNQIWQFAVHGAAGGLALCLPSLGPSLLRKIGGKANWAGPHTLPRACWLSGDVGQAVGQSAVRAGAGGRALGSLPRFRPFAPCRCGRALGGLRAWLRRLPRSKVVGNQIWQFAVHRAAGGLALCMPSLGPCLLHKIGGKADWAVPHTLPRACWLSGDAGYGQFLIRCPVPVG